MVSDSNFYLPQAPAPDSFSGQLFRRTRAWLISSAVLFGTERLSDEMRVPLAPVTGTLAVAGRAPYDAELVFHSLDGQNSAAVLPVAHVAADGTFSVRTMFRAGAPAGNYAVTVQWHPRVIDGEDYLPGPNRLSEKYADPASTPLRAEIVADSNHLVFTIPQPSLAE